MEELFTVNEAAKILRLNFKAVARYIQEREIPAVKLDRIYRINIQDLKACIQKKKQEAKKCNKKITFC